MPKSRKAVYQAQVRRVLPAGRPPRLSAAGKWVSTLVVVIAGVSSRDLAHVFVGIHFQERDFGYQMPSLTSACDFSIKKPAKSQSNQRAVPKSDTGNRGGAGASNQTTDCGVVHREAAELSVPSKLELTVTTTTTVTANATVVASTSSPVRMPGITRRLSLQNSSIALDEASSDSGSGSSSSKATGAKRSLREMRRLSISFGEDDVDSTTSSPANEDCTKADNGSVSDKRHFYSKNISNALGRVSQACLQTLTVFSLYISH